ncbi:calcyphosin-like protein [Scaptodrosophila lebanonensis]|uniref:Calcyphosin-like protein n=1 Tax=Drosophila lebanonensis TaxID=7225 RepID=A0A6J2T3H4_DROLE|nr:calcyphosin-like protein [Scaptodrosophila lebanonensis]XP_030369784.1 calcyphosin-like protein [Scaptodrosophila lebanonensis]XP_030369785.1 calcyphosin-like protein [Scaptodrosophila lebanonensis]
MMHREDKYTEEAYLKNVSSRELTNGMDKDPIYKLRLQCLSRGATGILGMARAFRIMDHEGNRKLNLKQFKKGIKHAGIDVTDPEVNELFQRFDADGNGTIDMSEFLLKLRPPLNNSRMDSIEKAFSKMDVNKDGHITVADFEKVYSVDDNPKYQSGDMTKKEILTTFLHNFDVGSPNPDGIITKEEFVNYYASISASIDNDTYFDLVIRQAYNL